MTTKTAETEIEADDAGEHPDDALAAGLAAGLAYAAAGAKVGLSERTVRRKMTDPKLRRRIDVLKGQGVSRAVALLTATMSAAAAEIARLMVDGEDEKTRLAAAKEIISLGLKARTSEELEKQVAELAERVEKLTAKKGGKHA